MANAQRISEKKLTIGKDTISYYDNLLDSNTTFFFIHGSFIDKDYWSNQLEHFSPKLRVIAIDLLGHGKSTHDRPTYTIEEYADDIVAMINELNLKKIIMVGHSIGADIMLAANAKIPGNIKGLIAVDYFKNAGFQLPEDVIVQLMTDLKNNFENANEQYARNALLSDKTDSSITRRVVEDFRKVSYKVGISMNEDFFHFPKHEEILLARLDKKLYLVNVDYQPTNETSLAKYLNDNYILKLITGSCHFPMVEHPKEINSAIEEFVQQIG